MLFLKSLSSSPNELKLNIEIDHSNKHSANNSSKKLKTAATGACSSISTPVLPAVTKNKQKIKMKKIKPSFIKEQSLQ